MTPIGATYMGILACYGGASLTLPIIHNCCYMELVNALRLVKR